MRIFELPQALLESLHAVSGSSELFKDNNDSDMEAMDSSSIESKQSKPVGSNRINPGQISRLGCQLCAVISFETVASQRAHFQSEWHIYNMSIKRQGTLGGPVTLEQFTSNTQQSPQSNGSEESEDESDLSFYEKSSIDGQSDDGGRVISIGSQFQYFQSQKDHCRFKVYRVLLRSGSDPVDMLRELQICNSSSEQCYWMILMLSGGHFAGAVFDNRMDGKMLVHNTIHRYVTRRKQGGGQSKKDQQGRMPKSAGATLRRHNQKQLEQDVGKLMEEWAGYLGKSQFIFFHAPGQYNRGTLQASAWWPSKDDQRLQSIPFTTYRPTLAELERIYNRLSSVHLVHRRSL